MVCYVAQQITTALTPSVEGFAAAPEPPWGGDCISYTYHIHIIYQSLLSTVQLHLHWLHS
jgi:hypothetical protein